MAVTGGRIEVTSAETNLGHGAGNGLHVLLTNKDSSSAIDVGGSGVTSGSAYELAAGDSVSLTLDPGETVYGVASSGTINVHFVHNGG